MAFFNDQSEWDNAYATALEDVMTQTLDRINRKETEITNMLTKVQNIRDDCVRKENEIHELNKTEDIAPTHMLMRKDLINSSTTEEEVRKACEAYGYGISSGSVYCIKMKRENEPFKYSVFSMPNGVDDTEIILNELLKSTLAQLTQAGYTSESVVCSLQCGYCYKSNFSVLEQLLRHLSLSTPTYDNFFDISQVSTDVQTDISHILIHFREHVMKNNNPSNVIRENFLFQDIVTSCDTIFQNIFKGVTVLFGSLCDPVTRSLRQQQTITWKSTEHFKTLRVYRLRDHHQFKEEATDYLMRHRAVSYVAPRTFPEALTRENFTPDGIQIDTSNRWHSEILSQMIYRKLTDHQQGVIRWWREEMVEINNTLQDITRPRDETLEVWRRLRDDKFFQQSQKRGFLYCVTNDYFERDNIYKIGFTEGPLKKRARALSRSIMNVRRLKILFWIYTDHVYTAEAFIHRVLKNFRLQARMDTAAGNPSQKSLPEFFQIPLQTIRLLFKHTAMSINGSFFDEEINVEETSNVQWNAIDTRVKDVFNQETLDFHHSGFEGRVSRLETLVEVVD